MPNVTHATPRTPQHSIFLNLRINVAEWPAAAWRPGIALPRQTGKRIQATHKRSGQISKATPSLHDAAYLAQIQPAKALVRDWRNESSATFLASHCPSL